MTSARNADPVRLIWGAIDARASRERLWDMPLRDIDIEAMAEEIVEVLDDLER